VIPTFQEEAPMPGYFDQVLPHALERFRHVVALIHVPLFKEAYLVFFLGPSAHPHTRTMQVAIVPMNAAGRAKAVTPIIDLTF
jgi:hypothetical protein